MLLNSDELLLTDPEFEAEQADLELEGSESDAEYSPWDDSNFSTEWAEEWYEDDDADDSEWEDEEQEDSFYKGADVNCTTEPSSKKISSASTETHVGAISAND